MRFISLCILCLLHRFFDRAGSLANDCSGACLLAQLREASSGNLQHEVVLVRYEASVAYDGPYRAHSFAAVSPVFYSCDQPCLREHVYVRRFLGRVSRISRRVSAKKDGPKTMFRYMVSVKHFLHNRAGLRV